MSTHSIYFLDIFFWSGRPSIWYLYDIYEIVDYFLDIYVAAVVL
jgi:hypothetical protein